MRVRAIARSSILIAVAVVVVLLAEEARGQGAPPRRPQSAAPPDAGWSAVVGQFAQALVSNDPGAVAPLLSDAANIHTMKDRTSDALRLLAAARQSVLVSARAYVYAPPSAAGDIAEAFRDSNLPGNIKELMIPLEEAELRRANATAALWLKESLGAIPGERVAIVVLWSGENAASDAAKPTNGITFVLMKGTPVESEARIQTIVYGSPQLYE